MTDPLNTFTRRLCVALTAFALSGCGNVEPLSVYTVPKEELVNRRGAEKLQRTGEKQRILAAIVPQGENTWYFKITGPDEPTSSQQQAFVSFLEKVTFDKDGDPEWALPEGWEQGAGSQFRFATIKISQKEGEPLDLSVSRLPSPDEDYDAYVLRNVNRWRGQVNLSPTTTEQLEKDQQEVTVDGKTGVIVSFVGYPETGAPRPPFAGMAATEPPRAAAPKAPTLRPPDEWSAAKNDAFSKAAYSAAGDVRITVTSLRAIAPLESHVNRWRREVGLPEVSEKDLDKAASAVKVDGKAAFFIEAPGKEKGLVAYIVKDGAYEWYFKLVGPAKAVADETERFKKFVEAAKFE